MMYSGDHKTKEGFGEILSIYAALNRGISTTVSTHFPELKAALLPSYSLSISPDELSGWWISGYFTIFPPRGPRRGGPAKGGVPPPGDCNFNVKMDPHGFKNSYYDRVVPSFNFSRSTGELPIISLLASYFEATANQRSDGARADVNIYAIKSCREVVYHFESFPILSCKQDEFNVWAKIVKDKEKLQVRNSKISLSRYMQHFIDLDLELDRTRKRNNS